MTTAPLAPAVEQTYPSAAAEAPTADANVGPSWLDRAAAGFHELACRPLCLFLVLLAANTLARPYANFAHDSRLYSVQVLNQADPGSFADDLFLKYGSQDKFSFFSRAAAPLVALFGLEASFFGLYLVFNGLFILAAQSLVLKLVPDRRWAVLGLLYIMTAPLPFGGLGIFQVHEQFLTPRIMANTLVLWGLERLLAQRYAVSFLLMLAAAAMHPLMALGGVLIWALTLGHDLLPRRLFYGLLIGGGLAGCVALVIPAVGLRLFGPMDDDWRLIVRLASSYNFPAEWSAWDWINVAVSLTVVGASAWTFGVQDATRARFLASATLVGVAGLLGTIVGSMTPYALLFQAQPYRTLWIVKALSVPLSFWLIARWWGLGATLPRSAAAGLALFLCLSGDQLFELFFPLFFMPILALAYRGLEPKPRYDDWLSRAGITSLIFGCLSWAAYKIYLILSNFSEIDHLLDGIGTIRLLMGNLGPLFWLLAGIALTTLVRTDLRAALRSAAILAAAALTIEVAFFVIPLLPAYRQNATRYEQDVATIAGILDANRLPGQPKPTIYSALGRIDFLWIELRTKSYFDWAQIVGCLFNHDNAAEGQRRALVVRAFEIDRIQEGLKFVRDDQREKLEAFFRTDLESTTPTQDDLESLCREENVDYAILKQEFPAYAPVQVGQLFLYDCRRVREGRKEAGAKQASLFSSR